MISSPSRTSRICIVSSMMPVQLGVAQSLMWG